MSGQVMSVYRAGDLKRAVLRGLAEGGFPEGLKAAKSYGIKTSHASKYVMKIIKEVKQQ